MTDNTTNNTMHADLPEELTEIDDFPDDLTEIDDDDSDGKGVSATGAVSGGFWGSLVGLIFLNPLLGLAVGASAGAVSGALTDVGIDNNFMKQLAGDFKNGSSLLFVLVRKVTPDKVLAELQGTGGKVIKTSLTHEQEAKLQAALDAAKAT